MAVMESANATRPERAHGQAMVEFALILPVFLVVALGIVDFGWAFKNYITLTNSAREGARMAVVCPSTDDAIKDRVVSYAPGLGLAQSNVTVTWQSGSPRCTSEKYVEVSVSYDHAYISPVGAVIHFMSGGELPSSLPMATSTKMRVE